MKPLLTFFCSLLLSGTPYLYTFETGLSQINWMTNYEEARALAQSSSKPIILFFTGSDWCGWCTKLEQESLQTTEFAQNAGNKFVFVKLDFPLNSTLPTLLASQNKELQKKFNIRGFPTLVILDSQKQNQIGSVGYRAGGGKAYADYLSKIVNDYVKYQQKTQNLNSQKLSSTELKKMYSLAKKNNYKQDLKTIIKFGEESEDKQFFLLEHYRLLAEDNKLNTKEAFQLKKQLLALDPLNEKFTHYQIALINFEALQESDKEKRASEQAITILTDYIREFGSQDKEHLWRIQMILSQVYFDKNSLPEALHFAESSYASAPSSAKTEIAIAIRNIQAQTH